MKENIETKDVQRTEYLDKNGLDMLWAKVKENTYNQVEVEYNRAKAEEDSLSQEIASVKPDEGKSYIQAKLTSKEQDGDICYYDVAGDISFKSEYSDSYSGPITIINKNGIGINFDNDATFGSTGSLNVKKGSNYNITMQGNGRLLHDTRDTFNQVSIQLLDNVDTTYANSSDGNSILISQLGIFYTSQGYALTSNDLLTGHGGYKTIGTDITPLENGKVPAEYLDLSQYAKKTDIPEVDTSNFVSKTTTDEQIINSTLGIVGGDIQIVHSIADEDPVYAILTPAQLAFEGCDRSAITVNGYDVNSNKGSRITIEAFNENPQIFLSNPSISDTTFQNYLKITNEGISSLDNNANHVFATDGSIADLTQYAKKSEITAGGNVDDVQVNGVSVVENKIANIKPATKESLGVVKVGDGLNITDGTISVDSAAIGAGNYIPYARYERGEYIMLNSIRVEGSGNRNVSNSRIGLNGLSVYNRINNSIHSNIQCAEIELQSDKNRVRINDDGIDIWKLDVHAELGISDYLLGLSKRGVSLYGGDDNHVLTSNASTIDITQYVLKSVYDEKIAALEARIAALEAKHTETA